MSQIDIIRSREEYLARKPVTVCPPGTAFGGHSPQRRFHADTAPFPVDFGSDPVPAYEIKA